MRIEIRGAIHTAVIEVTTSDGVPNSIDYIISDFLAELKELTDEQGVIE